MCYGYHIWSKEALMQAELDDDLDGGQRSSEVKWVNYVLWLPYFHIWAKEALMQAKNDDDDLHGGQRSSEVKWGKPCAMATIFGQKKPWCKLRMMMTLMEVKGHQRSNEVNYVLWLPYLVKRSADANWEWWWPLWRSEVKCGKLCDMATIFGIKKCWCKLRMVMTFMEVKGHQRSDLTYVPWLPYLVKRTADAS